MRLASLRSVWLRSAPLRSAPAEFRPPEVRLAEVRPGEVRGGEVRLAEERPAEVRPAEVRPPEVRLAEVRLAEVYPDEVRLAEVRPAEVRPAEVRPAEVRLAEVRPAEVDRSFTVLMSPPIPNISSLLGEAKLFLICHKQPVPDYVTRLTPPTTAPGNRRSLSSTRSSLQKRRGKAPEPELNQKSAAAIVGSRAQAISMARLIVSCPDFDKMRLGKGFLSWNQLRHAAF